MTAPEGFEHRERKNGDVAVFHHGKLVKLLRGADAKALLAAMKKGDPQQAMADASGGPGSSKPGHGRHRRGAAARRGRALARPRGVPPQIRLILASGPPERFDSLAA